MLQSPVDKQKTRLDEIRAREEEELARVLSSKYGLEYVDLSQHVIEPDALRLVEEAEARKAEMAPFFRAGKKVSIALRSPNNPYVNEILTRLRDLDYKLTLYMVSRAGLERAWARYKEISFAMETKAGMLDISADEIRELIKDITSFSIAQQKIKEVLGLNKAHRLSRILETILGASLALDASDVHIEPEETFVRIRVRLDGVLTDFVQFDLETFGLLDSRIKLLSGLKLNVKNEGQDGRFSVRIDNADIEIRTSVIPGSYGEALVMRILNPNTIAVPMEELGMSPSLLAILEAEIRKPNGMILNTGPTGSGKTTTLYAFLKKIHKPDIKIITIEDPVEYHLPGIVQTQTDKGYTFAEGLRSSLRQDPDVIMVGEIRDQEVAETAMHAALTGHLVFSTLHTNDAAGAFPRLVDLGINPKVISSGVNIVMAQRLVRILKPETAKQMPLEAGEQKFVDSILATITNQALIPKNRTMKWEPDTSKPETGSGFRGRIGVFEAIKVNEVVDRLIVEDASEREIAEAVRPQGIPTMLQDGVIKVLNGVTTLSELERVLDLGLSWKTKTDA
jgi:type IV pilus assembly protein PilB